MERRRIAIVSRSNSDDSSEAEAENGNGRARKRIRKSTRISCEICKARKVKCDKAEPSCGWCVKNNRVCVYKERRRSGYQVSYGVELEDKINRLESSLAYLRDRLEKHIDVDDCHKQWRRTQAARSQNTGSPNGREFHPQTSGTGRNDNSVVDITYAEPIRDGQYEWHQESQDQTPMARGTVASSDDQSHPRMRRPYDVLLQQLDELPPPDILYKLVDIYFKHVNTWSPILDRKATLDVLFGSNTTLDHDAVILLHAIVAVTLRFWDDDSQLTSQQKQYHHAQSCQRVQLQALETCSITVLKALALITIDAMGTSEGPRGWSLLSLLVRNIMLQGLGVEKSVYLGSDITYPTDVTGPQYSFSLPRPKSWIDDEGRRRLFWLTYVLDRYVTVANGADFVLDEKETDRSLPCRYDLFSKNEPVETRWFRTPESTETSLSRRENLGSFSYHCEVLRIMSQIHQFLRAPLDINSMAEVTSWRDRYRALDSNLNTWLSHLPNEYSQISQLCHSDPGSRVSNWIMIHAAFVTAVTRLHSAAAYPAIQSELFRPSLTASQRCLTAVESLRAIAEDVIDNKMLNLLGPPFAFAIWVSARLLLIDAATWNDQVSTKVWFLCSTLRKLGKYWDIARRWSEILTRLIDEGKHAIFHHRYDEPHPDRNDKSNPARTYSEMRRCAHDLASLNTRRPRTMLDPPTTQTTTASERDYYEAFEWFGYPRLPASNATSPQIQSDSEAGPLSSRTSFAAPHPDTDWLAFNVG